MLSSRRFLIVIYLHFFSDYAVTQSPPRGLEHASAPPIEERQSDVPDASAAITTEVAKASTSVVPDELVTPTPSSASIQEHVSAFFSVYVESLGARTVLPMGVAPEAVCD